MNLETKITIYKFTPQLFTLTPMFQTFQLLICYINNNIPIEKTLSYEDDY